jgi:hypothetical protein
MVKNDARSCQTILCFINLIQIFNTFTEALESGKGSVFNVAGKDD